MAYEGELVKMENGRWARYQRCTILNAGHPDHDEPTLLVAVELEEHLQVMLNAAHASLESYRRRGIPVQVRLDESGAGRVSLEVLSEAEGSALH